MKAQKKIFTTIASLTAITALVSATPLISSCSCSNEQGGGGGGGGGDTGLYKINITKKEGGTVKCDRTKADPGEIITFTIIPKPSYSNIALTLNGESIDATNITSYQTAMPECDLNVYGTFLNQDICGFMLYPGIPNDEPHEGAPNYFEIDGERTEEHILISRNKGITLVDANLPTPFSGVGGWVFDQWYLWKEENKPFETGDVFGFDQVLSEKYYILVAGYKKGSIGMGKFFIESADQPIRSTREQRFYLIIHYRPDQEVSDDKIILRTRSKDPDNYISCSNVKMINGTYSDVGLYENQAYGVDIWPDSEKPGGNPVQFSLWWAPTSDWEATFDVEFGLKLSDTESYQQKITGIHIIKTLYGIQIV